MSVALVKSLGVKGCSVWRLNDATEKPEAPTPNVDNVSVTLPSIELESTTINLMGSLDIPDITRIGNMQLTVTVPVDVKSAMALLDVGKSVKWLIRWVSQEYNVTVNMNVPKSYSVFATGFVTAIPNAEINAGAENTATITMNLVSYKKTCDTDNEVLFEVDRGKCILRVNNVDVLGKIKELY
jgi:phage tail tube protein FII